MNSRDRLFVLLCFVSLAAFVDSQRGLGIAIFFWASVVGTLKNWE